MINFLIKKKLNPEEKEILKGVGEVYINRLMNGELEKHSRAKAWTQILENAKRLDNEWENKAEPEPREDSAPDSDDKDGLTPPKKQEKGGMEKKQLEEELLMLFPIYGCKRSVSNPKAKFQMDILKEDLLLRSARLVIIRYDSSSISKRYLSRIQGQVSELHKKTQQTELGDI